MKMEIYHAEGLDLNGSCIIINAVRAIIVRNSKILLIYSKVNGDYKFPGGGIEDNETHDQALHREVLEECGLKLKSINSIVGVVTEYDKTKEENLDTFVMQSFYYLCEVSDFSFKEQSLDDYELELQFTPKWVEVDEAIETNLKIINSGNDYPRWVKRETMFLKKLKLNAVQ